MRRRRVWFALLGTVALAAVVWIAAGLRFIEESSGYAISEGRWLGAEARLLEPGRQFVPPGFSRMHRYPASDQVADFTLTGVPWVSRQGTREDFRAQVTYHIAPDGVLRAHREARGGSLEEKIVRPALSLALDRVARDPYGPETGTPAFRHKVRELLDFGLSSYGLVLVALEDQGLASGAEAAPPASTAEPTGGAAETVPGAVPEAKAQVPSRDLLLIGLDGADWDIIDPLVEKGDLPNLGRLAREGTKARLRTVLPALSPVIWTTVATGKLPAKHGILDFLAKTSDGAMVPVTSTLWQARSLWSILGDAGVPVAITAWWATWPADPVNGYMATDRIAYQLFRGIVAEPSSSDPALEARGKTWPAELFSEIAPLIVKPAEVRDKDLGRFVDLRALGRPDPDDQDRLNELKTILASTRTYEAIGKKFLQEQPRGFHAVYNESTDTAAHQFMPFRPARRPEVDDRRARAFGGVVDATYREADAMVGRFLAMIGRDWNVVILSDHGFRHGENRPATDPRVHKGPAADWHDRFGILILWGPDIRHGATVADATVTDVAPTILALYGLPRAADMDGHPLVEAFNPGFLDRHVVTTIASYERGPRVPTEVSPSEQDPELIEKLKSLGYIAGGAELEAPDAGAQASAAQFRLDSAQAIINRGVALMAQRDLDGAEAEFEKALRAGGGFQALVNLFNVHFARRDLAKAEATLDQIERANSRHKGLPGMREAIADLRGDRAAAEKLLRQAIRIEPTNGQAHERLGHILEVSGRLDEALVEYQAAVGADPNSAEAHNYVGNILRHGVRGPHGEPLASRLTAQAIRWSAARARPRLGGLERNADRPGRPLTVLDAVGEDSEGECLDARPGRLGAVAVGEHCGQIHDVGKAATVVSLLDLHAVTQHVASAVPSMWSSLQMSPSRLT
jgi:tetratricopeptide (TPR) repeat protein